MTRKSEPKQTASSTRSRRRPTASASVSTEAVPIEIPASNKVIRRIQTDQMFPGLNPRRSWSEEKYSQRKASIQENGILETGLVRPVQQKGETRYEIVDGMLRWTIARDLGISEMEVEVREMTDEEVENYALMQFVLREDLNPVDKTDAVLRLLARKLEVTPEDVITILNRAASQRKLTPELNPDDPGNVTRTEQWQTIENSLKGIGIVPESFRTNWLPILKMPDDILRVVRDGRLEYTKAKAISRIQNASMRQQLLGDAIAQQLSIRQIRDRIADLTRSARAKPEDQQFLNRFTKVNRAIEGILEDPKKRKRAEELIQELEELIDLSGEQKEQSTTKSRKSAK